MSSDKKNKLLILISGFSLITSMISLAICIYLLINKPKIAYVDNSSIMNEYNGIKEGKKLYEDKLKTWQMNIDTLSKGFDTEIKKYKQEYEKMSIKERQLTETLLKNKQQEILGYKKAIEEKASEEDVKLTNAVLKQIDSYILSYGKERRYDYIFGITSTGNLLYAKEADNITPEILSGLNKTYAGQ